MKVALLAVGALAVVYLALLALLYAQQARLLFPGAVAGLAIPEPPPGGFEAVMLPTADGERLAAWWRPPEPGRTVLVYFHGNGGSLAHRRERVRRLTAEGRGLLIVTYRGYPGSSGRPSEAGLRLDAEAAYRFLARYEPGRVVVYGESLGSGVAVRLASEHPVGGVVLDAPFTSVADVAGPLFWFAPVGWLLRDEFRSIDRIAQIRAPLLVLHGEADGLIPIALGRRLFAAAREPKRFAALPGVGHVDVLEGGGLAHVQAFLAEIEATPAQSAVP